MAVSITKAVEALRAGGIIIYPTDTIYGLGVDALSPQAAEKVYEIKGRPKGKPIHVIVSDLAVAEKFVELTPLARKLAAKHLPGALTLVLQAKPNVMEVLTGGTGTLGIRIPANDTCLEIARGLGRPFTATSANASGKESPRTVTAALASFGDKASQIAYVLDVGELPESRASTVVDARGEEPIVLREGPVIV